MSTQAKLILKYLILATAVVSALGPAVAELAGVVPATWVSVASRIIATAASIHLFLTESPLIKPFLMTKGPAKVAQQLASAPTPGVQS
jgi:hypothetical protein